MTDGFHFMTDEIHFMTDPTSAVLEKEMHLLLAE